MTTLAPPLKFIPAEPVRHRFTVADYQRLGELGLISEKTELIRGEVVDKMPQGKFHSLCVARLMRALIALFPLPTDVRCQSPVVLADSQPEPDFSISTPAETRGDDHPSAKDVYFLIEVSDSTLAEDRKAKRKLYAENGIPEYWIVNLPDDCVEVHTLPVATEQRYGSIIVFNRGQSVPLNIDCLISTSVAVDAILP